MNTLQFLNNHSCFQWLHSFHSQDLFVLWQSFVRRCFGNNETLWLCLSNNGYLASKLIFFAVLVSHYGCWAIATAAATFTTIQSITAFCIRNLWPGLLSNGLVNLFQKLVFSGYKKATPNLWFLLLRFKLDSRSRCLLWAFIIFTL